MEKKLQGYVKWGTANTKDRYEVSLTELVKGL